MGVGTRKGPTTRISILIALFEISLGSFPDQFQNRNQICSKTEHRRHFQALSSTLGQVIFRLILHSPQLHCNRVQVSTQAGNGMGQKVEPACCLPIAINVHEFASHSFKLGLRRLLDGLTKLFSVKQSVI